MNATSMAKSEDESKSDGQEILSIGALFSGTNWDKKYWSSSRITSNDKHFASGETPDRAWESFQKKYSRIKLWHGKRFSGKIDGWTV